ncbi:MAG: PKD domain-containing protein [Thermoplasmatales archaeon]|nr:MAG: PKD domain-containing protein [Thermoplasmatales archaeon]
MKFKNNSAKMINKTNLNKLPVFFAIILLLIMAPATIAYTTTPCTVRGYIYIDNVITKPDNLTISFPEQNVSAFLPDDPIGYYILDFSEKIGEKGIFIIIKDEMEYIAAENFTVLAGVYFYDLNLTAETPPNQPPYPPTNPDPEHNKENMDLNPTLIVNATDPDNDSMNVYFYNAVDDSLIGFEANVSSGSTASTTWNDLSYETVYNWYAVANDSEYNTSSEQWSFVTKNKPSEPKPSGGGAVYIPPLNKKPIADVSAGEPYHGSVGENILFDGSNSYDPDGTISSWEWNFGDGSTGTGEKTTHAYSNNGTFYVTLKVTDNYGNIDKDSVNIVILKANNPPKIITIDGPESGDAETEYAYATHATDPDSDDTIVYTFDWGDGTNTVSDILSGNTSFDTVHSWLTYGAYVVTITAEDGVGAQDVETITVYIDVLPIDDKIKGYLVDEESINIYELFDNINTGKQTDVQKEDDDTYLIDSDGNGEWDYAYNLDTGLSTYYDYLYQKYYQMYKDTPGFELISLLATMMLVLIILRRKNK